MGLSLKKFKDDILGFGSRAFDQVNPFDAGLSYKTRQVNPQVAQQSVVQQAVRQAPRVARTVGNVAYQTKPASALRTFGQLLEQSSSRIPEVSGSSPARFMNNLAIRPIKSTDANVGKLLQGDNPYSGSFKQQAGQASQDVINMASVVPIGKAVNLARSPLKAAGQGFKTGVKLGGGFGAAQGASTSLQNEMNMPDTLKTVGLNTAIGAAGGGVIGGAAPVLGAATRPVVRASRKLRNKDVPYKNEEISLAEENIGRTSEATKNAVSNYQTSKEPRLPESEIATLSDYQEYLLGRNIGGSKVVNPTIEDARRIGKKLGVDVTSGSSREISDRINKVLDARIASKPWRPSPLNEEGSIRLPGRSKPESEQNLSGSSPNNTLPDNISPKTRSVIESVRAKQAPTAEAGPPKLADSLLKEAPKSESGPPAMVSSGAINSGNPNSPSRSVPYSYSAPQKGSTANEYTDYIVNKYIGAPADKPQVRARYRPSRLSTEAQEIYRGGVVDPIRDATNALLQKGLTSSNPLVAKAVGAPSVAFNRFGLNDEIRGILRSQRGQQENAGRVIRSVANDLGTNLNPQSLERIDRFIEEPEYLARAYGDGTKLSYDQLSPDEKVVVDAMIDINKLRNDINLEIGNITPELHAKYADGMHSPRIYDIDVKANGGNPNLFDASVKKKRSNINDVAEDIFDNREASPLLRSMVRAEIALRDKATYDAMKGLEDAGLILDRPPNKSFSQLKGSRYGVYNGKYVYNPVRSELDNNLAYNTRGGKAVGDLVEAYQSSKLGTLDRFFKSTKTTLAPATFLGNVVSNPVAFNPAAGVNTITQAKNMAKTAPKVIKDARGTFDRSLYEARKLGVGVGDTGKQLTGDKRQELQVRTKNSKNPYTLAGSVYGGADQTAQVALYDELVKRGLSPETAARRVLSATQDYEGVGRLVQNLADTPILGKPFARFSPEFLRLMKNNAIYNPVGSAAKVGAVAYGANKLSEASGESDEERAAREDAVGQTQIPGTGFINKAVTGKDRNLSLNFALPDRVNVVGKDVDLPGEGSAVNIARLTGFNNPMEPGANANQAIVRSLNPVADLDRKDAQGNIVFAPNQAVSSLTFRPLADQAANRDFMGREISDPTNKTYIEGVGEKGKKFAGTPSAKEQRDSRIQALAASYLPGFNEANALFSAKKGQKDYYGKERTLGEAVARVFGAKTESNKAEARKRRADIQDYFEGKVESTNKFLRENPDLKDAYATLTSNTRTRDTNTKIRDIISPEKWSIIKGDNTGRLFDRMQVEAFESQDKNGKPVDPIFLLNSPERIKEIIELRSRPTGDDIEREEILRATTSWYSPLEKAERAYYKANEEWFNRQPKGDNPAKDNPRVKAYSDIPFTEQTPLASRYMKLRYGDEETGTPPNEEAGRAFFKANADQLSADFKAYKVARLNEINAKRAIEGFSPIDQDTFNNVTFGYEDDERKVYNQLAYGKRYSRGGGRGGKKSAGSEYKYAIDLQAGGSVAKPKVSVKTVKSPSRKVSKKTPKISIKKSKV